MKTPFNNLTILGSALVFNTLITSTNAFWRMECRARSGFGRIDPLASPGEISKHAHTIHGSSGFGPDADYDSLMAGDCTSCSVSEDKSAYWTPAMYFQSASGEFTLVNQVGGMLAYYFLNPAPGETKITAFPAGFRMIAGDTNQRNFSLQVPDPPQSEWSSIEGQDTQFGLEEKAKGFNCLNYAATPEGSLTRHFLPDKAFLDANCLDGIRLEVMFPSCWNGKDVDSDNHKDHTAYPDLIFNGACPSGFETRLPGLFYETIWDTYAFKGQDGQFVISNGDPTGYGYHGDFIMGWDESLLQDAVDTCTNESGRIQDCPLFTIQDSSIFSACNFSTPSDTSIAKVFVAEDVVGPMSALPGNVAIQSGPGYAGGAPDTDPTPTAAESTAAAVPSATYSPGFTASVSGSYVPGAIFIKVSSSTESSSAPPASSTSAEVVVAAVPTVTPVAPAPTEAPVLSSSSSPNNAYTTLYTTSGREVIAMVVYQETIYVDDVATTTVYEKRHLHSHRHRRGM